MPFYTEIVGENTRGTTRNEWLGKRGLDGDVGSFRWSRRSKQALAKRKK
jgi:hypothetical protein